MYLRLFFFLFNLNYLFISLYNIVFVLPYIDLNPPWVYIFLHMDINYSSTIS